MQCHQQCHASFISTRELPAAQGMALLRDPWSSAGTMLRMANPNVGSQCSICATQDTDALRDLWTNARCSAPEPIAFRDSRYVWMSGSVGD